jgi:putative ABC transport system permease protein
MKQNPPKYFLHFFRWYCHPKMQDYIEGDLMEVYEARKTKNGKLKADVRFIVDVLLLFRPGIIRPTEGYKQVNNYGMFKNYLKVAFRNIVKQRVYNLLNVVGLAVGIASGLIIAIHIREEMSYEKEFSGYENVYRIHHEGWAKSSPVLAEEIKDFMPEIDLIGRFSSYGTRVVNTDNNNPGEVSGYYADSTILKIFQLEIIEGSANPLAAANTVVITKRVADRYFGEESAVGKILKFDNRKEFPVTAVIEDLPENTHLKFDYLVSMPTFYKDVPEEWTTQRGWMDMYTYAKLKDGSYPKLSERMPDFIRKYYAGIPEIDKMVESKAWQLMPLADIHLHSNLENEMGPNGNITYLYIFFGVELLILIVACANFLSLFTTQATTRIKEVGMRKIMGALPSQLISQFLMEVILLTCTAIVLAIGLYYTSLPLYNNLSGRSLDFWQIVDLDFLKILGIILGFVVILAGLYPAIFIASFNAGSFLRSSKMPTSLPNLVRNGLVIFQFAVSVSLISASIFIQQQLHLMKNNDLGFNKDQIVNIKLYGYLWWKSYSENDVFKNEFLKSPDILAVAKTGNLIGDRLSMETVVPFGKDPDQEGIPSVRVLRTADGYLEAMDINFIQGRDFSTNFNDSTSFIINESAAKLFGFSNPINETLDNFTRDHRVGKIVGVVKDFHFASLRDEIEPLIIEYAPGAVNHLAIKIRAGKTDEGLDYIKKTVSTIAPNSLFAYEFLDDRLNTIYKSDDSMGKILQFFSVLAIIIASLGLLGLSAHAAQSRIKEIGIRKVLGANLSGIVVMISSRFVQLVLVAIVMAVPLTWYAMDKWLNNFAYKITINGWVFAGASFTVLLIASIVTSVHSIKAATVNPADSLRLD